jgi:hypothetical protein
MLKLEPLQENFSGRALMKIHTEGAHKLRQVDTLECIRPLNQNAVESDGIRGRCGFPEITGGGMPQR